MSHLIVTNENSLEEVEDKSKKSSVLQWIAILLSYIFHPVFIPVYIISFLLYVQPFLFLGASAKYKALTLGQAFINYTFFPLVSILLLKAAGFIKTIKLEDRKDRIIPFIVCNIWYFWIWYVWRGLPDAPRFLVVFAFSVFLASSIGLLANIYLKISMHGIAAGTATAFMCLLTLDAASPNISFYLALTFLITGLIGTARLYLGAHTPFEYYWGLAVGTLAVCMATFIV